MKQLSFERWARRELATSNGGSFSLGRIAAKAQSGNDARLRALLLLYAIESGRLEKLETFLWNDAVIDEYRSAAYVVGGRDVERLALRATPLQALDDSYRMVLEEFLEARDVAQKKVSEKRALWKETREAQLRQGVSNGEIYRALGLNPGNVNAYLKHGAVEKVSVVNARRIRNYLKSKNE